MARYIDAEAFLEYMMTTPRYFTVKFDILRFPTADVEPVRHGEWIPVYKNLFTPDSVSERTLVGYQCSLCKRFEHFDGSDPQKAFPYCHCGAKMDK